MHHCLKSVLLLFLGFLSSHRPSFRKCWCWLVLDLTKEDRWKVFRPHPEHTFLLPSFFSWLLSWNADGFRISSHTTGNNNQPLQISACLLVAIYMFTGSKALGELGRAPGALSVVTFSQSYLSLSLFSSAMGESFWCEENPFPFTFLWEALPSHLILFP